MVLPVVMENCFYKYIRNCGKSKFSVKHPGTKKGWKYGLIVIEINNKRKGIDLIDEGHSQKNRSHAFFY